jgi:glycosyltransferase involved in cell wall biosynthesis
MKIAFLIHQDPRGRFGGSEVYANNLARAAVAAGHAPAVICRGDARGQRIRREDQDGIAYMVMDQQALAGPPDRFALRASFDNPRAFELATHALMDFRPHHLHVHHFLMTSSEIATWAAEHELPVTATLHDYWAFCHRLTWQLPDDTPCPGANRGLRCRGCGKPEYNRWPGKFLQPAHAAAFVARNRALRRAYRVMRAIFSPSEAVLAAHHANGFGKIPILQQPYGLPATQRSKRTGPAAPLRVGFVGRLAPEKGIEKLIKAARSGGGYRIHIYGGGDAAYDANLRRQAAALPVVFHGSFAHDELPRVLDELDVVAVPSVWRENLPLTALEAAEHGVPVLVAPLGGMLELPALCGAKTVENDTPAGWGRAFDELANPAKWRELVQNTHYERRIEDDLAAILESNEQ